MTRLETILPDLVQKLNKADKKQQREVSYIACSYAIENSKLSSELTNKALENLKNGKLLKENDIQKLNDFMNKLDDRYFILQEEKASTDSYMKFFNQARAVAALIQANNKSPFFASSESIYEAISTSDDNNQFISSIETLLKNINLR